MLTTEQVLNRIPRRLMLFASVEEVKASAPVLKKIVRALLKQIEK